MRLSRIVTVTLLLTACLSHFAYAQVAPPTLSSSEQYCLSSKGQLDNGIMNLLNANEVLSKEIAALKAKIVELEKPKNESVQEPTK